jgi:hypothetical protein
MMYAPSGDVHSHFNHAESRRHGLQNEELQAQHLDHCFDYLRQSIVCSADLTVEWARVEDDRTRQRIDGWNIPHRHCKDPDAIEAFVAEHRTAVTEDEIYRGD